MFKKVQTTMRKMGAMADRGGNAGDRGQTSHDGTRKHGATSDVAPTVEYTLDFRREGCHSVLIFVVLYLRTL